jgi:transcriptional regulator with XRE-family HTH domain
MEFPMGQISWGVLQRLFDDEPPLKVWREERGFEIEALADRSGIGVDRLAALEYDLSRATDGEIDRLATALRVPLEYLFVPSCHEA